PQGGEWPEAGAKPGVEHIRILFHKLRTAFGARIGRVFERIHGAATATSPNWNPLSPPQLTTDIPIADVLHPIKIRGGVTLGYEGTFSVLHTFDRRLGQLVHAQVPLV